MKAVEGFMVPAMEEGAFTVRAEGLVLPKKGAKVLLQVVPGKGILPKQRRLCYGVLQEIARWQKESVASVNEQRKMDFLIRELNAEAMAVFSLSDAPFTLAADYLRYLIHFVIDHGIVLRKPLIAYAADTEDYLKYLAMREKCAVCGRKAMPVPLDTEGFTENCRILTLCPGHQAELMDSGKTEFLAKYRFKSGLAMDKATARVYGLKFK